MKLDDTQPRLFLPDRPADQSALAQLRQTSPAPREVDTLDEQLAELWEIDHADRLGEAPPAAAATATQGVWAYYPWRHTLVRVLPATDYRRLRSSRNQLLITAAEQTRFAAVRVAVAGLNVGNPAAVCLALEGGAGFMRFADFDTLSVTNLNRFRAGLPDLGLNKAVLSARQVTEIDPYAEVDVWADGLKPSGLEAFLDGIDVLVEEMDNLPLKLAIRATARHRRLPVVMVTGNGANVVIDIERYDQDPTLPLLNGTVPGDIIAMVEQGRLPTPTTDRAQLAGRFMGEGTLVQRLDQSFPEVGRRLAGIPQLAESSFLRGAAVCHVVRRIATGRPAPSGRYHLRLDEVIPDAN